MTKKQGSVLLLTLLLASLIGGLILNLMKKQFQNSQLLSGLEQQLNLDNTGVHLLSHLIQQWDGDCQLTSSMGSLNEPYLNQQKACQIKVKDRIFYYQFHFLTQDLCSFWGSEKKMMPTNFIVAELFTFVNKRSRIWQEVFAQQNKTSSLTCQPNDPSAINSVSQSFRRLIR